jgi:hypothetical protein
MRLFEVNVYKLNELSSEVQEKVLSRYLHDGDPSLEKRVKLKFEERLGWTRCSTCFY